MAKVASPVSGCRTRRAPALWGLIIAAMLAGLGGPDPAQALGGDKKKSVGGSGRPPSGWRLAESRSGDAPSSAVLPAAQTWSVHRPAARRARAALVIRCIQEKLELYMSFPDRVWSGETVVQYRLDGGRPRHVGPPRQLPGGTVRLGGSELIRNLVRADVLEVLIEDVGLGASEAVFHTAGARAVVDRMEGACRTEERPAPAAVAKRQPPASRGSPSLPHDDQPSEQRHRARQTEQSRDTRAPGHDPRPGQRADDKGGRQTVLEEISRPSPQAPEAVPSPDQAEPVPEPRQAEVRESEPGDRSDPVLTPSEPSAAPISPGKVQGETQPQTPAQATVPAGAEPSAEPARPGQAEPLRDDAADRSARLTAFIQRYGPNREGALIYGWYHQCLDRAGIDREQIWYLSNEELAYLSRGETDRVRLTMLVSTDPNLDAPPRRVTCYGTARGRNLVIERTE